MSSKRESFGKRPVSRSRRRFLAWNAFALFSLLLDRRRGLKKLSVYGTVPPGREARYYRRVGSDGDREG